MSLNNLARSSSSEEANIASIIVAELSKVINVGCPLKRNPDNLFRQ